jgi:hypothetical protein
MNDDECRRQIRELVEQYGLHEEDAAFAVRFAAGETAGDVTPYPWPLPTDFAGHWTRLLIDQHGFTPDEAARYLAGDRSAIEAVAARRSAEDHRADNPARSARTPTLTSD